MATSKTTNTYNRQNWEDAVNIKNPLQFSFFFCEDNIFVLCFLVLFYYYLYSLVLIYYVSSYFYFTLTFYYILLQEFPILCQTCLGDNPYIRMVSNFLIFVTNVFRIAIQIS